MCACRISDMIIYVALRNSNSFINCGLGCGRYGLIQVCRVIDITKPYLVCGYGMRVVSKRGMCGISSSKLSPYSSILGSQMVKVAI